MTTPRNWVIFVGMPLWLWLSLWAVVMVLMQSIEAYPTLVMPQIYRPIQRIMDDGKTIDLGFPQMDDDVLQLEHLRQPNKDHGIYYDAHHQHHQQQKKDHPMVMDAHNDETSSAIAVDDVEKNSNAQIEIEQQVETAATEITSVSPTVPIETPKETQTSAIEQNGITTGIHRPPHLPIHDGGKTESNIANGANDTNDTSETNDKAKAAAKCRVGMHGAARLMYGQNPEVLPTTATSTSTSMVPEAAVATIHNTMIPGNVSLAEGSSLPDDKEQEKSEEKENYSKAKEIENGEIVEAVDDDDDNNDGNENNDKEPSEAQTEVNDGQTTLVSTTVMATSTVSQDVPQLHPMRPMKMDRKPQKEEEPPRQLIGDVITDESPLRRPASRRSLSNIPTAMSPKMAESLLKRANDGQYSSFDMSQYIFWTGDESGVAHAVDELIQNDMMSREDALKFLHEIRVGLEYLQKSYANRIFPQEIHHNTIKKSHMSSMATTRTTTTSTTTTTPYPLIPYIADVEQNLDESGLSERLEKTFEKIALWHKLQSMHQDDKRSDSNNLNDNVDVRNTKITNCQDKEYNLEEIIYKLARIMFMQSLSHDSEESQREIEKLMDFLERERELGVITGNMERKVLHVLLQALSDTLTEKPELWTTAQYLYKQLLHRNTHANYNDNINI